MTMYQSDNGLWYGSLECLLLKIVTPKDPEEDYLAYTEVLVGSRSPFGGIMVDDVRGLVPQHSTNEFWKGREEPISWWESQGFIVTMPEMFHEIVDTHMKARA